LVFDGVFLLRPELLTSWELSTYLSVHPEVALERAVARDTDASDEEETVRHLYAKRYVPGHDLYEQAVSPARLADVVDNTDPRSPMIVRA
jgi:uridine kinase